MDNSDKSKINFKAFIEQLCRYYMEFLETDFKARRNPSRKVVYRKKDLLITVPLFKYDRLKEKIVNAIHDNFANKGIYDIKKGKYTIKLSEKAIENINDSAENISFENFQIELILKIVEKHLDKKFPNKEEFLKELEFEIENLIEQKKEEKEEICKEHIMELLSDFVCYDFYDELYELWKNKTILEGEELYLYFYDIAFQGNKYPLFFLPITLNKRKETVRKNIIEIFDIEFGGHVLINKFAIEFVSQAFAKLTNMKKAPINIPKRHLYVGDIDVKAEMQKMLNEICSFFDINYLNLNYAHPQKAKGQHVEISNNFYTAICDKSDESLLNDFEELMQMLIKGKSSVLLDIFEKLNSDFLTKNPKVVNTEVDDKYYDKELTEKLSYHSPIPLNEEQQKIMQALRHSDVKNIIIEGPPGTGKSHTITAIIFNALLENKTVLMVSDKKEALDVVENKITETLDRVKKEGEFLRNPLLRLGKKETNYSKIFKQQNFEKIKNRYNASRRLSEPLEKEIKGCTKAIKNNVDTQTDVYANIDLNAIKKISDYEPIIKKGYDEVIDFSEAYSEQNFTKCLKQVYDIIMEFSTEAKLIVKPK